jgi:DNA-binding MarR family transcriptional regulator
VRAETVVHFDLEASWPRNVRMRQPLNALLGHLTRLLTAMDSVRRVWARDCDVDAAEILILILLASKRLATSDIAFKTGRHRQHVHRSLLELESRGYVEPARLSCSGKTLEWSVTEGGAAVAQRFLVRTRTWQEELLARHVDLQRFTDDAEVLTRSLVNHPTAESWRAGLTVPRAMRLDRQWDLPAGAPQAPRSTPRPRRTTPSWTPCGSTSSAAEHPPRGARRA